MVGNMFPQKSPTEHTPTGDWVFLKLWIPKMIRYPCVIYLEWRSTVQKVRGSWKLWLKIHDAEAISERIWFLGTFSDEHTLLILPFLICAFVFPPFFYTQQPPLSMEVVNAGRTGNVVLPGRLSCTCCQGYRGPPNHFPYEGVGSPNNLVDMCS